MKVWWVMLIMLIWLSALERGGSVSEGVRTEIWISPKGTSIDGNRYRAAESPKSIFGPIQISPSVVQQAQPPVSSTAHPLYPYFPTPTTPAAPVFIGQCPLNLSAISPSVEKTAKDCTAPIAPYLGNVICCPQFSSMIKILQGEQSRNSGSLVLNKTMAKDCFKDVTSVLVSAGANESIPSICSLSFKNLTGGSCPVKDVKTFENVVNTSELKNKCGNIDPLVECCRPSCLKIVNESAVQLASKSLSEGNSLANYFEDCKGVVFAWLARELDNSVANSAFRILKSCKVNKDCPLSFKDVSKVAKACSGVAPSKSSCCKPLNNYILTLQRQMLITNKQALNCATLFGSMLLKEGVLEDLYKLCDVDLKDFSLQVAGEQGCLLRSLPTDVVYDKVTGVSFVCDLSDNIDAPWPSSATLSSLSTCAAPGLPALPTSESSQSSGLGTAEEKFVSLNGKALGSVCNYCT